MLFASAVASTLLFLSGGVQAAPASTKAAAASPYFVLAGDSTTAIQNEKKTGGGWGTGFLNFTLANGASGKNFGHNGATTKSFREGGDWDQVIAEIGAQKSKHSVYVTIQFGHNDQKTTSGVSLDQYTENLATFAKEVKAAGGNPILVTPLTRRSFTGTPLVIKENLANERNRTIQVAQQTKSWYIDLNKASTDYCNKIGKDASTTYNLISTDNTHLNDWGSVVFGRIVSDLLLSKYSPTFKSYTKANATLSNQIKAGIAA